MNQCFPGFRPGFPGDASPGRGVGRSPMFVIWRLWRLGF